MHRGDENEIIKRMAKEVTVLGIEGAFLRGVRLEERNGAFVCADVASWPLAEEAPDGDAGETPAAPPDLLEEAPVETVAEEDKPLARALREAVKHFGQTEFTLAIPLSKLLVKGMRLPVAARDDLLGAMRQLMKPKLIEMNERALDLGMEIGAAL